MSAILFLCLGHEATQRWCGAMYVSPCWQMKHSPMNFQTCDSTVQTRRINLSCTTQVFTLTEGAEQSRAKYSPGTRFPNRFIPVKPVLKHTLWWTTPDMPFGKFFLLTGFEKRLPTEQWMPRAMPFWRLYLFTGLLQDGFNCTAQRPLLPDSKSKAMSLREKKVTLGPDRELNPGPPRYCAQAP